MFQLASFFVKTQIQMIEYGLNYIIWIKKEFLLIPFSFTTSQMSFQTISMLKAILAKFLSQKNG